MDADLPKSVVKRLVKATLDRLDQCGGDGKTLQLNKVWNCPPVQGALSVTSVALNGVRQSQPNAHCV